MVNLFLDQSHHGNLDQSQQVDLEQSIRYQYYLQYVQKSGGRTPSFMSHPLIEYDKVHFSNDGCGMKE